MTEFLALLNDVLQAIIVIFGTAVVLYNLRRSLHSPVIRPFTALIGFVVIVYLSELLVSRIINPQSADVWLRIGWVGITFVPAAQFHLSYSLLATTGDHASRRRTFMWGGYLIGFIFLLLALFTDLIVGDIINADSHAPHLTSGPFFWTFALYFWLGTVLSARNVWMARGRTLISSTKQRMTITLAAFLAAPLAVFPYLVVIGGDGQEAGVLFWLIVIAGNLAVGGMFALLTSHLVYFDANSPDRVVRVRLFKFMARVPMTATIVLLVYVLVNRNSPVLGLPLEAALGFTMVATVMLVEWAIHEWKRPFERLFALNDNPDVRRIQQLSERLLTTRDLHQFLESVLSASCEALRTPTAFVAAITADGPQLEAVVGHLIHPETALKTADLQQLAQADAPNGDAQNGDGSLHTVGEFIIWRDFWLHPLYNESRELMLGIFGIRARADEPDLSEGETAVFARLIHQAEAALEDRILQQEVFAAVEGLLPEISALQQRRREAAFGGLPVLTAEANPPDNPIIDDPAFNQMVKDALSHYWGGPKLTDSPLMRLEIVKRAKDEHDTPQNALRAILVDAIELQKPEGERSMTTTEWILYNILELKFLQGKRVRDVARRLAMSESDLYRKQRVAIENVAHSISHMEENVIMNNE